VGAVKDHTAHPFTEGDITLVHNGTLNNKWNLPKGSQYSVDSQAICAALNTHSPAEIVKLMKGAWSLVWWDARDKTLNFLRNDERPMHFLSSEKDGYCLFGSEALMLKWLAVRNGLSALEPLSLKTHTHVVVDIMVDKPVITTHDVTPPKPVAVKKQTTGNKMIGGQNNSGSAITKGKPNTGTQLCQTRNGKTSSTNSGGGRSNHYPEWMPNTGDKMTGYLYSWTEYEKKKGRGFVEGIVDVEDKTVGAILYDVPEKDFTEGYYELVVQNKIMHDKKSEAETGYKWRVICKVVRALSEEEYTEIALGDSESKKPEALPSKGNVVSFDNALRVAQKAIVTAMEQAQSDAEALINSDDSLVSNTVIGYGGILVTPQEFDEQVRHGCSFCQGNIYAEDAEHIHWLDRHSPF
jgi:hypothetical protein